MHVPVRICVGRLRGARRQQTPTGPHRDVELPRAVPRLGRERGCCRPSVMYRYAGRAFDGHSIPRWHEVHPSSTQRLTSQY